MADEEKKQEEKPEITAIGDHKLNYFRRFVKDGAIDYETVAAAGFNEKQIENIKLGVEQAGWFKEPELVETDDTESADDNMHSSESNSEATDSI